MVNKVVYNIICPIAIAQHGTDYKVTPVISVWVDLCGGEWVSVCNAVISSKSMQSVISSALNFQPIFTKFGTRIAEIISKAEFVCNRKRNYFARMQE